MHRLLPIGILLAGGSLLFIGLTRGLPMLLLAMTALGLVGVIALVWASLNHLAGTTEMTLDEALSLGAPSAEEEQKRAILRALKDLMYELRLGKISREDFDKATEQYQAEARRMIAAADESLAEAREQAETTTAAYLADHPPVERDERDAPVAGVNQK